MTTENDENSLFGPGLSQQAIESYTGYRLQVMFPTWQTDKAGVISFHDELERLGKDYGWENVLGSLFVEEERLVLGIFMNKNIVIEAHVVQREIAPTRAELDEAY